ncbi:MAG: protease inhibitor I9 family protein [Pseudomonadota bacterium]|nr:protease inhibitor I9 family protein [Pseudomonadota bacterium]
MNTILKCSLLGLMLCTCASTAVAGKHVQKSEFGVYNVRMIDPPVIGNKGANRSFAATQPTQGKKINKFDRNVQNYRQHLRVQHDQALDDAGIATANKVYDHGYAINGFTVKMSFKQAQKLTKQKGIASVTPVRLMFNQGHDGGNNDNAASHDQARFLGVSGKNSPRAAGLHR